MSLADTVTNVLSSESLDPPTASFGSTATTASIRVKALADWTTHSTGPWEMTGIVRSQIVPPIPQAVSPIVCTHIPADP